MDGEQAVAWWPEDGVSDLVLEVSREGVVIATAAQERAREREAEEEVYGWP